MNLEDDYKLALRLQKQIDEEEMKQKIARKDLKTVKPFKPNTSLAKSLPHSSKTLSLVDRSLEYTDPNPDIHALFLHFNDVFFWGKLLAVEVKWSPRMTSCAGICCYQGRGGLCSIRLSLPLLKLRPRKDLVETLLHEMIHAYLFVTCNNRDRDGHGPEFQKHMHRINQSAGTKITVYHSFHDEVRSYQQHWWQCQGPCRNRKPFFGTVRRAMNRPPGPYDFWWNEHKSTCGGEFIKIREPEGYSIKKGGKNKVKGKSISVPFNSIPASPNSKVVQSPSSSGIQKYFTPTKSDSIVGWKKGSGKGSAVSKPSSSHVVLPKHSVAKKNGGISDGDKKQSESSITAPSQVQVPKNFLPKKQESTADKADASLVNVNTFVPFSGVGRVLGSSEPPLKKAKVEVKCPVCGLLQPEENINEHLDKCIDNGGQWQLECPVCGIKVYEEAFDDHLEKCVNEEIVLSSDEEGEGSKANEECVCPACGKTTNSNSLAHHLDQCLSSMSFEEEME